MKIFLTLFVVVAIMGLCVANVTVQGGEHPGSGYARPERPKVDHSKARASHEEHTKSEHAESEHAKSEESKGEESKGEEHSESEHHQSEHPN